MAPKGLTCRRLTVSPLFLKPVLPVIAALLLASCSTGTAGTRNGGVSFSPFSGVVAFYRGPLNHLSAVRRGECPMYPSCSEYAREAVARHGEVVGWIMANDRLMRCGRDETRLSPKVKINGEWRCYDPLDRNDFWWSGVSAQTAVAETRP